MSKPTKMYAITECKIHGKQDKSYAGQFLSTYVADGIPKAEKIAMACYEMADAMLAERAKRLREMLTALHAASSRDDLARPSWRLHGLSGDRSGFFAMTVQANWRLVFRFDETNVELLDYIDYH